MPRYFSMKDIGEGSSCHSKKSRILLQQSRIFFVEKVLHGRYWRMVFMKDIGVIQGGNYCGSPGFFFVTWVMPDGVNDTAIVLIHKVPHPKELKDFL